MGTTRANRSDHRIVLASASPLQNSPVGEVPGFRAWKCCRRTIDTTCIRSVPQSCNHPSKRSRPYVHHIVPSFNMCDLSRDNSCLAPKARAEVAGNRPAHDFAGSARCAVAMTTRRSITKISLGDRIVIPRLEAASRICAGVLLVVHLSVGLSWHVT